MREVCQDEEVENVVDDTLEGMFREFVGETAALSPNAIVRLKQRWESDYREWCGRMLA